MALLVLCCSGIAQAAETSEPTILGACHERLEELFLEEMAAAEGFAAEQVRLDPKNPYCKAALGELYLFRGNHFWAVSTLHEAHSLFLDSEHKDSRPALKTRLLLCIALTATQQWEDAREFCAAESVEDEGLRSAFSYYAGIAAFKAGDEKQALAQLDSRTVDALEGRFRETAVAFRNLSVGKLIGSEPGFRLATSLGFGYDSNALMAPDDPAEVGLSDETGAWRNALWTSVGYVPKNIGAYQLNMSANLFRSFHTTEAAAALNTTEIGAAASLQRYGASSRGKWAAGARYGYRLTLLDGGGATVEKGLFAFSENHSLSVGPSWWRNSGTAITLRYGFSYQRFAELVRNGMAHSLSVGEEFRPVDELSITLAQSGALVSSTDAYRRYGLALGVVVAWAAHRLLTVVLRGTVQFEDYYTSAGYFGDENRRDLPYFGRAEVHVGLGAGFVAGAYGGVAGRVSSIDTLDFFKWEGGLLLDWSLGGIK